MGVVLADLQEGGLPGNVELAGLTTEESTDAWVRFIWFLRVAVGINPDKIGTYLSATRKQLERWRIPTEFTSEDSVFIKDARTTKEEALTLLPPEKRARGQMTVPGRHTSCSAQGAVGGAAAQGDAGRGQA